MGSNVRLSRRQIVLLLAVGLTVGVLSGLGGFTFIYAQGASYMTNDPRACANCHVMRQHLDGWSRSSHHNVATCNDCHTPHNFVGKYMTKALNGYHHSLAFTLGNFHEPIQIGPRNRRIAEQACRSCHENIVQMIDHGLPPGSTTAQGKAAAPRAAEPIDCLRCHANVGHME
jgi:cytochrome c nitrite reductase small subunit